jgi:formate dehydrogenase subunit delta
MMDHAPLVRMANQIARSFQALGEERAVDSTANHIKLFWSPPMRQGLEALRLQENSPLSPIALKAAEKLAPANAAGE